MQTALSVILALSQPAHAAEPTPVLVSALEPTTPEATALATLLENYLAQEIGKDDELRVVRIEDTRDFQDYSARIYMRGCPPGDYLACTSIIAERGNADFAVTGRVRTTVDGSEVEVDILDMVQSRVVVSFKSELAAGDDKVFAQGVARVLAAAIHGEIGQEDDIRDDDDEDQGPTVDNEAVARQIAQLSQDLGEVTVALSRPNRAIPKTTYTVENIAEDSNTDAAKPWERLDMGPGEYIRYKNSGFSLLVWRQRAAGRKGQVMIAPTFGYANGPMAGAFHAAYATDENIQLVDSWSAQTQQTGGGGTVSAVLGYGVLPVLDIGLSIGFQTGHFTIDVDDYVVNQPEEPTEETIYPASRLTLGPRVSVGLLPASSIRPRFGVGLDWMRGYTVTDFLLMPEEIAVFDAPQLFVAVGYVGGEARLSKNIDFVLQVPISVLLTGAGAQSDHTGTQAVVPDPTPAQGAGIVGAGIQGALQIRLFGAKGEPRESFEDEE